MDIKNIYGAVIKTVVGADLRSANLRDANLRAANLCGADLRSADLRDANLCGADLRGADLRSADLRDANLRSANLRSANLYGADLRDADLRGADLRSADLRGAKNAELSIAMTRILPEGQIIGWKKLKNNIIAKLSIPAEAKRSHAFGRKCRAEFVDVLEITGAEFGVSLHDQKTVYRKGERVLPDSFNLDWTQECASGIHFYITREEAENHA